MSQMHFIVLTVYFGPFTNDAAEYHNKELKLLLLENE